MIYNESIYGRMLPSYFTFHQPMPVLPRDAGKILQALAGVLVSPSRGLLIYTPIFVFSIGGMLWAVKMKWRAPLTRYLIAVIVAHWLLLGVYYQNWTGGHSCGPRLFADLTPFFIVFLIPALLKAREAAQGRLLQLVVFTALLCASLFIHSSGARSYEVYGWNSAPANDQVRAWDWRDPQFLRGLDSPKFQHLFRFLGTNQARDWNPFYFCANL